MVTFYNLLTFHIDDQLFAIDVEPVEQIVSMVTITPIPQASSIAEGIINVHGEAVPVVDLCRHLGKPGRQLQYHTPIILMKIKEHTVGLIVDSVNDVVSLQAMYIVHPSDILPEELRDASILNGVAYTPAGVVLMLDPDQLFQPDQFQTLARASEYLLELVNSGKLEPWHQP
jgi:purine-binding chemotaxis protein CheW